MIDYLFDKTIMLSRGTNVLFLSIEYGGNLYPEFLGRGHVLSFSDEVERIMARKEAEPQPREISKAQFLAALGNSEIQYRHLLEQAVEGLQGVVNMRHSVEQAEADDQVVKFYDLGDSVSYNAYPKPPMGFLGGEHGKITVSGESTGGDKSSA